MTIVLGLLEGYSRSISPIDVSDMVVGTLDGYPLITRIRKAYFANHQVRRYRRFIRKNQSFDNVLYLVGKSLGGLNVFKIFNTVGRVEYKAVYVFTMDINYPSWSKPFDLTPNLNHVELELKFSASRFVNVYLVGSHSRQQCGAKVVGAENYGVRNYTHQSMVCSEILQSRLVEISLAVKNCEDSGRI